MTTLRQPLVCAPVVLAALGWCAGACAQDNTMSLEEASYRAGKARIMARYQEDLATCKGLGNAQARSACAAAAGVNRNAARRTLKSDTGPTRLSRYLAQVAAEQHETTRPGAHKATPRATPAPGTETVLLTSAAPARVKATAAAAVMPVAPAVVPPAAPVVAVAVAAPSAQPARPAQPVMVLVPAAAEASTTAAESSRMDGYALALKTYYGGN